MTDERKLSLQLDLRENIEHSQTVLEDSLFVILFPVAVKPLSVLLRKHKGYTLEFTGEGKVNVAQTVFFGNLKLNWFNIYDTKKQLDLVKTLP